MRCHLVVALESPPRLLGKEARHVEQRVVWQLARALLLEHDGGLGANHLKHRSKRRYLYGIGRYRHGYEIGRDQRRYIMDISYIRSASSIRHNVGPTTHMLKSRIDGQCKDQEYHSGSISTPAYHSPSLSVVCMTRV